MRSYTLDEVYEKTPADLIFALERDAQWTQEQIAYVAQTSQSTICRIRSGKNDPAYSVVRRLQEAILNLKELGGNIV